MPTGSLPTELRWLTLRTYPTHFFSPTQAEQKVFLKGLVSFISLEETAFCGAYVLIPTQPFQEVYSLCRTPHDSLHLLRW